MVEDGGESWWEKTKDFEVIPGTTFGTQPWFIVFSVLFYHVSLVLLSNYMEKKEAYKLRMFTAVHKYAHSFIFALNSYCIILLCSFQFYSLCYQFYYCSRYSTWSLTLFAH